MQRTETININPKSPRLVFISMRKEGISGIYDVDDNRNLKGYVTAEDAAEARRQDASTLDDYLTTDVPTVDKDKPMDEIFDMIYDSSMPIAVKEDDKLVGIIIRGAVIAALSGNGEVNLDNE